MLSGTSIGVRRLIKKKLLQEIEPSEILKRLKLNQAALRRDLTKAINTIINQEKIIVTGDQRQQLQQRLLNDLLGFGPLEPFLHQADVTEIMVNGPYQIYIEKEGQLLPTTVTFDDEEHLLNVIDKILSPLGRRVDEVNPVGNARLPDGSRINVILPPLALNGPVLTVRKFRCQVFSLEELVKVKALPAKLAEFLKMGVRARLNILVSGGTGTGKTTLLNALANEINNNERIITIEDSAELQFNHPHVVSLESRPANIEGKGEVTIRDLVINALRMRPDRLIVGEVRAGEALDMLQAMNTGHDGSLTTAHANSPREAILRLETMVLMSGIELPQKAIRQQIFGGLNLIVHLSRDQKGNRCVQSVFFLSGLDPAGDIKLQLIYQKGMPFKFVNPEDLIKTKVNEVLIC